MTTQQKGKTHMMHFTEHCPRHLRKLHSVSLEYTNEDNVNKNALSMVVNFYVRARIWAMTLKGFWPNMAASRSRTFPL